MESFQEQEARELAERSEKRRPLVEAVVSRLKKVRFERISFSTGRRGPVWTDEEHALLLPFAELVKSGKLSYHRGGRDAQEVLPNRSFGAIKTKMKSWVEHGEWMWYRRIREFTPSSYKDGKLIHTAHAPKTR